MSSSHPPQYASYSLPPVQDSVRLPSIKDLNFPPPGQDGSPANGNVRQEHPRQRHDTASWSRSNASTAPPPPQHPQHSQHSSNMPPPHDPPPKSHPHPSQRHDASYGPPGSGQPQQQQQQQPGMPTHNGMSAGPPRSENGTDPSSKRSRPQAAVSASPGRSPHTAYPPYPGQAPPGYYQGPHPPAPPPHEQPQHPSQVAHGPPPGYSGYPPPPLPQRHYPMPPPPAPGHHQAQPPPSPYPPPAPPPEHWQQHPPSQPPQQHPPPQQFNGFTRTTPLVPAPVETRASAPSPADAERAVARQHVISEILKHCGVLYGFANHYSQAASTHPHVQPAPPELEEMNSRASTVMRLLDDLRRLDAGEDINRKETVNGAATPAEEHPRPPKRPWEDMARDGEAPSSASYSDAPGHHPDEQAQSTAEQDMQIIRNKRQSSAGGAQPGQQKNKYRKRSRATPPGKCHSCNIRETPEWRRGPDGARTLCNACGLHYAKLMRKRDKAGDANGKAPPIDLQTLRASTASARGSGSTGSGDHSGEPPHSQGPPPQSPYEQPKQIPPMQHAPPPHPHQGPYQLMPVGAAGPSGQPHQMMPPPPHGASAPHSANGAPPPPPWLASPVAERGGYSAEPQSYMRASHPPSHARASPQ